MKMTITIHTVDETGNFTDVTRPLWSPDCLPVNYVYGWADDGLVGDSCQLTTPSTPFGMYACLCQRAVDNKEYTTDAIWGPLLRDLACARDVIGEEFIPNSLILMLTEPTMVSDGAYSYASDDESDEDEAV
jgi:hypothetical protein